MPTVLVRSERDSISQGEVFGLNSTEILHGLEDFLRTHGKSGPPLKPSHRVAFHWPPHPISKDFHVLASDWTGRASFTESSETFEVEIARTAQGVFGRVDKVWNEARGSTIEEVVEKLQFGARPYLERQRLIGESIGVEDRYRGRIADLGPLDLIKLLYCQDRDIAHEAQVAIETHASDGIYSLALIKILEDERHPHRRSAQWCVLDMFEDLPSFCPDEDSQSNAIRAIKSLIFNASDDFARTIYKAGVVLGGHICTSESAQALFECTKAPSPFGRRSAIHAVFHLAEWMPERREAVVALLLECSERDPLPELREFAGSMAKDVQSGAFDHMAEPALPGEDA